MPFAKNHDDALDLVKVMYKNCWPLFSEHGVYYI